MWGADPTTALTGKDQAAVFVALDHCSAECVGIHAAERADRFEALEPGLRRPRQCREPARACGAASAHSPRTPPAASPSGMTTARGTSAATSSASCASSASKAPPAFVRPPEGNGCAERFIRTLKEKLLWVRAFDTVEELRRALLGFRDLRRDMADRAARLQTAQRRPAGPASDRGTHRIGCNLVMLIIRGRYTPAPPRIWRHPSRMPVLSLYDSRVVLGALGQLSGPSGTSAPRARDYGSQTGRGIGEPDSLGAPHIFHVDARSDRVH